MNSASRHITAWAVSLLVIMTSLMACRHEPHIEPHAPTGQGGLITGLTADEDITVTDVQLFLFNESGRLVSQPFFTSPEQTASHISYLHQGAYTIMAVTNTGHDITAEADMQLAELAGYIKSEAESCPDIYTGMTTAVITSGNLTRAEIILKRQGAGIDVPTLHVQFRATPNQWDECPDEVHMKENGAIMKCVAELRNHHSGQIAAHITSMTMAGHADHIYSMDITAVPGIYDLLIWTEYGTHYVTDRLDAVTIGDTPPGLNRASSGSMRGIELTADTTVMLDQASPMAAYRIVATDLDDYRALSALDPLKYPPLTRIAVTMEYVGYFPSEFNVLAGKVTDAITGFRHEFQHNMEDSLTDHVVMASATVLTHGSSSITAILTVTDMTTGTEICRIPGMRINYTAGLMTTIQTKLFTRGINAGGITMDTDWDDIIIYF